MFKSKKELCAICGKEMNFSNKSLCKIEDQKICFNCQVAITKIGIQPLEFKKYSLIEIEELLRNYQERAIVKVSLITNSTDSRKKVGSSIIRGTVGAAALGPVGLIGGAMSGKNKTREKCIFLIEYSNGDKETKEVYSDSKEFEELCKKIEV